MYAITSPKPAVMARMIPGSLRYAKKSVSLSVPFCRVQNARLPKKIAGKKRSWELRMKGLAMYNRSIRLPMESFAFSAPRMTGTV